MASVVTTDLVVRTLPEISDASEILPQQLNEPMLLYVVDGPVTANGYDWYQVQPFGMHYLDFMQGAPPFGWVAAAGKDGEEWIAPGSFECPDVADLDAIRSMSDIGRFACFGGEELTLEGEFDGCFVADPTVITPEWLIQTGCSLVPPGYVAGHVLPDPGGLQMRLSPELVMPNIAPGASIRVVGHFDDPDARTCEPVAGAGDEAGFVIEPMEPAEAVLLCRAQFVVTHIEEIIG